MIIMMEGAWEAGRALAHTDCEALLAGIARGEKEAFERFYRVTDRAIYAFALSLTRSHHDAQDVMMDAPGAVTQKQLDELHIAIVKSQD